MLIPTMIPDISSIADAFTILTALIFLAERAVHLLAIKKILHFTIS
jgi:hypothetical protein